MHNAAIILDLDQKSIFKHRSIGMRDVLFRGIFIFDSVNKPLLDYAGTLSPPHTERLDIFSVNYLLWGYPKIWYFCAKKDLDSLFTWILLRDMVLADVISHG